MLKIKYRLFISLIVLYVLDNAHTLFKQHDMGHFEWKYLLLFFSKNAKHKL